METTKTEEKKEKLTYWDKFYGGKDKIPYQPLKEKPYRTYSERQEHRKEVLKTSENYFEALSLEVRGAYARETEKAVENKANREAIAAKRAKKLAENGIKSA